jgi:hypothetical protein
MARKSRKPAVATQSKKQSKADQPLPFGRTNYLIFGAGLLAVILGFITLALGSDTLAPILLVAGYCVIIPVAIILRDKRKDRSEETSGG